MPPKDRAAKIGLTVLGLLCAALAGFFIGAIIGTPAARGQMLAAGAIVLMYGLIGAVVGTAIVGVLAWNWPLRKFRWVTLVSVVLAAIGFLAVRQMAAERRAARERTNK